MVGAVALQAMDEVAMAGAFRMSVPDTLAGEMEVTQVGQRAQR